MQEEEDRDYMAVAKHFMSLPNLDMQVVSQATGLSVEVLEKLRYERISKKILIPETIRLSLPWKA